MDVNMDPAVTDPDTAVDSSPGLNVTPVPGGKPIPLSPFLFITASYHGTQAIPLLFLSHLTTVFLLIKCPHPITWCHKTLGGTWILQVVWIVKTQATPWVSFVCLCHMASGILWML